MTILTLLNCFFVYKPESFETLQRYLDRGAGGALPDLTYSDRRVNCFVDKKTNNRKLREIAIILPHLRLHSMEEIVVERQEIWSSQTVEQAPGRDRTSFTPFWHYDALIRLAASGGSDIS